jgi:hypothetical protein
MNALRAQLEEQHVAAMDETRGQLREAEVSIPKVINS